MGLLTGTDRDYYAGSEQFVADAGQTIFTISGFVGSIAGVEDVYVYINNALLDSTQYSWSSPNIVLDLGANENDEILVVLKNHRYGDYRYISLKDIVSNFMLSYIGDGKIINRANRRDVLFHAKRAIQEFSYDILRVEKIQEVEVGNSLSIPMPRDYVNYVSVSYVDESGIERNIPYGRITSKPSEAIAQDDDANYQFDGNDIITTSPITDERFKNLNQNDVSSLYNTTDEFYNTDYINEKILENGKRYGSEPELMNKNGMFLIDEYNGTINFSSNLAGYIVTIKYISDGLGTDAEMKIHKLAEEAVYKTMAFNILSAMTAVPEYVVNRFRKDRRAAQRNAKLRIQNLKIAELSNVMRGKSKQIKH
jgi:hypothetical protein